ncbi:MAG: nucleoside-diphosphate sugar epimerase, partial [Bacteroidales bacterium]|nr:nucleoside-diphosphate sugar epimerase [Bacteroidales bacterium]
KLGEEQMLTFSSICDKFVEAHGMKVDLCETDEEAKLKASQLKNSTLTTNSQLSTLHSKLKYPVVYFKSDTTGEKAYEEFYVPGEKLDMKRFKSLGVIEEVAKRPMNEIDSFFAEMEHIFAKADFTKEEVVQAIKKFIPNFEHEEKGKNLDQKM